jgi:collagenase-like PrtC family protease
MKFAIGYQQPENGESFPEIVNDYREHISEVYFPWVGAASGRAALGKKRGGLDWNAQYTLEDDLIQLRRMGIKLDLLFNANCYGSRAVSQSLENEVISILEHIEEVCNGVDTVTTTSLAVARTVKKYFPKVEVRASVNMRIGSPQAMSYISGLFDSFYIQRDIQRNIEQVKSVKAWCDKNNKGLYMLANSGCLRFCPGQTFHDNMVAHDAEIDEMKNIADWTPHVCWNLYRDKKNYSELLKATWIRPEDLHHYDELFPVVKLATRQHMHPRMVIDAYVNRRYAGNLADLFEPGFSPAFAPYVIDNQAFPEDWFEQTSTCKATCHECGYCDKTLEKLLVKCTE